MQAIVTKFSAGKDSAVRPIAKISMSVEEYLASAVCFISRVEREIGLVSGRAHKKCTPFKNPLPSQDILTVHTWRDWWTENAEVFRLQAQVSGLTKGGDNDDNNKSQGAAGPSCSARKRSREEFEGVAS